MEKDLEKCKDDISEEFIQDLINFGLSNEEAKVYYSLLKRGTRGEIVGRIKNELNIGRTTIYAIMERLANKNWILSEELLESPKRIKYIAKPPLKILNSIIEIKEKELKKLKGKSLFIGDNLDKIFQGAKKLTIDTIHVGGYKYLKSLVEKGWKIKSEVVEHTEDEGLLALDYELKGRKGIPKDCGLIILQYDRNIENDKNFIREAFELFKAKTEYEIKKDKISGFEDVKIEDATIKKYLGANIHIKLKFKKNWWFTGKQALIPVKNRIFLIFGNQNNFEILMDTILNAEKFHHLV